jgi:PAS domain S-box-containing protein
VIDNITPADISDPQELIFRAEALSVEMGTRITPGFEALVFKASRGIEDIYELTYIRRDGSHLPAVVSVTALRDAQDEVIGYLLIGTDNTARKQVEAEHARLKNLLKSNEDRFRLMIEGSEQVVFYNRDTERFFTYLSPSTLTVVGYDPSFLLGKTYETLVIADDPISAHARAVIIKTLKEGLPFKPYAVAMRHKDGHRVVLEIVESPIFENNKIVGFQGFARDVTERIDAQNDRALSEARFRSFFEQAAVGMVIASESGKFLQVNQQFADLLGYTKEELVGKLSALATHPDDREYETLSIAQLINGQSRTGSWEQRYLRKDGSAVWCKVDLSLLSLKDDHSKQVIVVVKDISERKIAQQEILLLNSELEDRVQRRTQQLETANKELGAFSYSISHDLRSPLSTINGFTQLLVKSDGDQLTEKGKHYLDRIRMGAVNMGKLIDGLLSLVQTSRAAVSRVDIDLTEMSIRLMEELRDSEPDRMVDVHIQAGMLINGDSAMVTVIMQNLIGNAWKYSSKTLDSRVEIGSETLEDGVTCIFVRDNGAGFDMAYAENLFEAFQRLHKDTEFKGTGIGLANVKRMVERHGGRVWAQAELGRGATFRFTLDALQ